eukprot:m.28709 g.28709  ORF g.28709 m.28709 type:complete len:459 (+) comp11873_c0_seq6:47-1423(+)
MLRIAIFCYLLALIAGQEDAIIENDNGSMTVVLADETSDLELRRANQPSIKMLQSLTELHNEAAKLRHMLAAIMTPVPFGRGTEDLNISTSTTAELAWPLQHDVSPDSLGPTVLKLSTCPHKIQSQSELMLHQTQHPSRSGTYEFAIVQRVQPRQEGCSYFLTQPLSNAFYTGSNGTGFNPKATQVVLVGNYRNVHIGQDVVYKPQSWNGQCGGILVLKATGNVTVNGHVSADGCGFRGASNRTVDADYKFGYAGESELVGYNFNSPTTPTAFGSGGGPGLAQGGGAGGAHATVGAPATAPNCAGQAAGEQATPLSNEAHTRRLSFGGSGASSGVHRADGSVSVQRVGAVGGKSGGIVAILAQHNVVVNGIVSADGIAGQDGYIVPEASQSVGGGGGGAGGTASLYAGRNVIQLGNLTVAGGLGGKTYDGGGVVRGCYFGGYGGSGGDGVIDIVSYED